MTSIVLAAATFARIAVADFDVDAHAPRSGHQVAVDYAMALTGDGCASSPAAFDLSACGVDATCRARVAKRLGVDYLVRGQLRITDRGTAVGIDVVTIETNSARHFDESLPFAGSQAASPAAPAICRAISEARANRTDHALELQLRDPTDASSLASVTGTSLPAGVRFGAGGDTDTTEVRIPLRYVVLGSAALTGLLGIGLGAASAAIRGGDHPKTVNGVTYHTIPVGDAHAANSDAVGADVFFAFTGLLAITGGVMVLYRW